ncbi:MAG: thioredoxin domain-containing protein [Candidatus Nanopelagicales bacterium]
MADESKKDARQKAAEARAAQQAAERRRERMIRIIGGLVVVIVVVGIIGGAYMFSKNNTSANGGTPTPDDGGATPTGVSTSEYYVTAVANTPAGIPTVKIYEDFQCPFCKRLEETSGRALIAEAQAGKINLQWQPGIFMDKNLQNSGSLTATNAWGCAIDAGKTLEFHEGIFAEQPAEETVGSPGFTNQQMLALGTKVGITGEAYTTFESCVNSAKYNTWAANSNAQFDAAGVSSTPSIFVNGKELPNKNINIYDPAVLLPAIEQAAKS